MARKPRMATLWEVSDAAWERVRPILDLSQGPKRTGRPRVDRRRALDGIIFQRRTGCPWNHIPRVFGDDSTIHRYYRDWSKRGILEQIWSLLVVECQDLARAWAPAESSTGNGWATLPVGARAPSSPAPTRVRALSPVGG